MEVFSCMMAYSIYIRRAEKREVAQENEAGLHDARAHTHIRWINQKHSRPSGNHGNQRRKRGKNTEIKPDKCEPTKQRGRKTKRHPNRPEQQRCAKPKPAHSDLITPRSSLENNHSFPPRERRSFTDIPWTQPNLIKCSIRLRGELDTHAGC